uniref:Nucleolar protein 12 n=1 Tax=Euplotes harpa TaxID=151035 RepID=A0A7S3JLK7_9SPIT
MPRSKLVLTFDQKARKDFVCGFRKRKDQRRKIAQEELKVKARKEKAGGRRAKRDERDKRMQEYEEVMRARREQRQKEEEEIREFRRLREVQNRDRQVTEQINEMESSDTDSEIVQVERRDK